MTIIGNRLAIMLDSKSIIKMMISLMMMATQKNCNVLLLDLCMWAANVRSSLRLHS